VIPIYKPYLAAHSLTYAHEALDSSWVSSQGKYLTMATEKLRELLGVPYVLLLNNGTSAMHLVAKALRYISPSFHGKKRLICPNNVYVAAWNSFLFDGDYELIPIDADLHTWNFDLNLLDRALLTYPDADVLVVHNIGNVINVPKLKQRYPTTNFVEDNCEGFLGTYDGAYTGTAGLFSAASFFANKNCTSGEGGMFATHSEEAYHHVKCIHGQGQSEVRFVHDLLGYNYRMTNIQAAILYGRLECLPTILDMKRRVFERYRQAFDNRSDIFVQQQSERTTPANWMFGVRVPNSSGYREVEAFFTARSIEIRPMFYSVFTHKHLQTNTNVISGDCGNADLLRKQCFILPSFPELNDDEQRYIIATVEDYLKR
jgi:perosamine synthetase